MPNRVVSTRGEHEVRSCDRVDAGELPVQRQIAECGGLSRWCGPVHQRQNLISRTWAGEVEPLCLLAAERPKQCHLLRLLDPFGYDPQAQRVRQCQNRTHDRRVGVVRAQPRESGLVEDRLDLWHQAWLAELPCRQVDRDRHVRPTVRDPLARLSTGFAQYPAPQRGDETRFLSQRDELPRRDHSTLGMLPAHQCFDTHDLAAREGDARLIVQHQLAMVDGVPEVVFHL